MAGSPVAQTQGGDRVLFRAGGFGSDGGRTQFHADRSDQGALLERRHQWSSRSARHGDHDGAGTQNQLRDGTLHAPKFRRAVDLHRVSTVLQMPASRESGHTPLRGQYREQLLHQ